MTARTSTSSSMDAQSNSRDNASGASLVRVHPFHVIRGVLRSVIANAASVDIGQIIPTTRCEDSNAHVVQEDGIRKDYQKPQRAVVSTEFESRRVTGRAGTASEEGALQCSVALMRRLPDKRRGEDQIPS
ncbi:hypothetical protein EXIGLDRAFT_702751 [Exidia glandulosa HHB12029]|uniref:Uncharacterized protein n=1 Tax=Exidia glandulosa HHB12029 TaxID=1314781 RepID=A0A165CDY3_EXIGL|nr:hypothetical protein EXIGLDRAFT_702751 [Exidia glandulosa HHB12029]